MKLKKEKESSKEKEAGGAEDIVVKPEDELAVRPQCKMRVCEDPKTGELVIVYSKCPRGYIEKIAGRISVRGIRFRKEESEDDEEV